MPPKLDLFDLNLLLLELGFVRLLGRLVLELAKIHDPADRRRCQGSDFNQIQSGLFCGCQRTTYRNDTGLFPFSVDQTHFRRGNVFINALLLFLSDGSTLPKTEQYQAVPARASTSRCQRSISESRDICPRS